MDDSVSFLSVEYSMVYVAGKCIVKVCAVFLVQLFLLRARGTNKKKDGSAIDEWLTMRVFLYL